MITEEIRAQLFLLKDEKYADFHRKLIPTVSDTKIIGVRTPAIRSYAKEIIKREDKGDFLSDLPHKYYDENQLHVSLLCLMRDFDSLIALVEEFLPYIDNWATCDSLSPKVFKKHREKLLLYINKWIKSEHSYTVRFAIGMLMEHFLDEDYKDLYPQMVAKIKSDEYYINMMIAWYFATALAKQHDAILPFLENAVLPVWCHNKTIQKAVESYRITAEQKEYLKTLRRRLK